MIWESERCHGELSADNIVNSKRRTGRAVSLPAVCDDWIADPAQSLVGMKLVDEGIKRRVISVPYYGYVEYDGRRLVFYYDIVKFGDVAPELDSEPEHTPFVEIALICGLELEPKDLAPRAKQTCRNSKSSKGARSLTAAVAFCCCELGSVRLHQRLRRQPLGRHGRGDRRGRHHRSATRRRRHAHRHPE